MRSPCAESQSLAPYGLSLQTKRGMPQALQRLAPCGLARDALRLLVFLVEQVRGSFRRVRLLPAGRHFLWPRQVWPAPRGCESGERENMFFGFRARQLRAPRGPSSLQSLCKFSASGAAAKSPRPGRDRSSAAAASGGARLMACHLGPDGFSGLDPGIRAGARTRPAAVLLPARSTPGPRSAPAFPVPGTYRPGRWTHSPTQAKSTRRARSEPQGPSGQGGRAGNCAARRR